MDVRSLIDQVIAVAHTASAIIPGAGFVEQGAKLGKGVLDVIDALEGHATIEQQPELQAARAKLSEAVKAKAKSVSDSLR